MKTIYNKKQEATQELNYNRSLVLHCEKQIKEYENNNEIIEEFKQDSIKRETERKKHAIKQIDKQIALIIELEAEEDEILKYVVANKPLKDLGRLLSFIERPCKNPFIKDGLTGYSLPMYKIINFAIEHNKYFLPPYKTIINNLTKTWDIDKQQWV